MELVSLQLIWLYSTQGGQGLQPDPIIGVGQKGGRTYLGLVINSKKFCTQKAAATMRQILDKLDIWTQQGIWPMQPKFSNWWMNTLMKGVERLGKVIRWLGNHERKCYHFENVITSFKTRCLIMDLCLLSLSTY